MSWHWRQPRRVDRYEVPPFLREMQYCVDGDPLWQVTIHYEDRRELEIWFVTMSDLDTGREIEVSEGLWDRHGDAMTEHVYLNHEEWYPDDFDF